MLPIKSWNNFKKPSYLKLIIYYLCRQNEQTVIQKQETILKMESSVLRKYLFLSIPLLSIGRYNKSPEMTIFKSEICSFFIRNSNPQIQWCSLRILAKRKSVIFQQQNNHLICRIFSN